jgi:hypothetical protein
MPHAVLWQPSDWSFAPDTIEIAARFYEGGKATYASELRYREVSAQPRTPSER